MENCLEIWSHPRFARVRFHATILSPPRSQRASTFHAHYNRLVNMRRGNSHARYSSAVGRFLTGVAGDIFQLRRVCSRSIELDVVRTLSRSAMPVVHRVADPGNRTSSQTRVAEQVVALHLPGADWITGGRRGALDPFRFPAGAALGCFVSSTTWLPTVVQISV